MSERFRRCVAAGVGLIGLLVLLPGLTPPNPAAHEGEAFAIGIFVLFLAVAIWLLWPNSK